MLNLPAWAIVGLVAAGTVVAGAQRVGHGIKAIGQKAGHELKYEPPKVLHLLGMHRGHLKKDGRKI